MFKGCNKAQSEITLLLKLSWRWPK